MCARFMYVFYTVYTLNWHGLEHYTAVLLWGQNRCPRGRNPAEQNPLQTTLKRNLCSNPCLSQLAGGTSEKKEREKCRRCWNMECIEVLRSEILPLPLHPALKELLKKSAVELTTHISMHTFRGWGRCRTNQPLMSQGRKHRQALQHF